MTPKAKRTVSREEFDELVALVQGLSARLEALAAAPRADDRDRGGDREAVTPEEIAIIAAAVTAFLGKPVRVKSARRVRPPVAAQSPWGLQGRIFIQASHALGAQKR